MTYRALIMQTATSLKNLWKISLMRLSTTTWLVLGVLLAACGKDTAVDTAKSPQLTAATLGDQEILTATGYLASDAYLTADPDKGRQLAFTCRACHTLEAGGAHMIGPNLHGFFGQPAGTRDGFDYSKALQESGFAWTPRALDAWLKEPAAFLPGNRMSFIGVSSESDRRNLIAFLLVATDTDNR